MDELDKKILKELQNDCRNSFREISKRVDSTPVTVINRVRKMEDEGIIKGYTVDLDYEKLGYSIIGIIGVTAEGPGLKDLEKEVSEFSNIRYVYEVTGDTDVFLVGYFKGMDELQTFVKSKLLASSSIKTVTHVVTNTYKESSTINLNE